MRFNVAQLLKEGVGARRSYAVEGKSGVIDALNRQRSVVGQANVLRTPAGILVHCHVTIEMEASCSRCLEPFTLKLSLQINEEFFPTADVHSGALLPPPDDAAAFTIDESHLLDLTEAVRQYALLAEPMKPVCTPNCLGLCPTCGRNRNLGPCSCPAEPADPRWAPLLKVAQRARAG